MDIAFVIVVLAIALGGTVWHSRVLAKNAKVAQERRAKGEPEPGTIGKRVLILACVGALIGLSALLVR